MQSVAAKPAAGRHAACGVFAAAGEAKMGRGGAKNGSVCHDGWLASLFDLVITRDPDRANALRGVPCID